MNVKTKVTGDLQCTCTPYDSPVVIVVTTVVAAVD